MHSTSGSEHASGSPLPQLARAITTGAVRLAAATAAWLRLVAEFDERGGWHGVGISSCAHWLAWQCGMSPVTAREHVRVARALGGLPAIAAAFDHGRLSYAKVRAVTRIAAPDCEAALLDFALSATASQTERFCRAWRHADDGADESGAEPRPEVGHSFQSWTDEEGYLTLTVRMPAEAGAALLVAIDSLAERDARRERAQNTEARAGHAQLRAAGGRVARAVAERCAEDTAVGLARERTAARRIAALGALAEARLAMDRRPGDPPRREVVVHVDAAVLADDAAAGRAHYEGGPAITGAQARRLLCEATAVIMLEQGREPLAVGRRRRRATKAQRRALLRRDGGCARPGCPETRIERLHAHHMRHWLHGGRTDLANLVLLCDTDHGLVHDHDLLLNRTNGRLIVLTPDGVHIWGTADPAFTTGLAGLPTQAPAETRGAVDTRGTACGTDARDPFIGVHPNDTVAGRRPTDEPAVSPDSDLLPPGRLLRGGIRPPGRPDVGRPGERRAGVRRAGVRRPGEQPSGGRATAAPSRSAVCAERPANQRPRRLAAHAAGSPAGPVRDAAELSRVLFPDGAPPLADTLQEHHDRMDLRFAIGVLMGNRDLVRRLAAEAGVPARG